MKRTGLTLFCLLLLAGPAFSAGRPSPPPYTIAQITDSTVGFEWDAELEGGQLVWIGVDPNSCGLPSCYDLFPCDTEVYLYDGSTRRQLSQNYYGDVNPVIHSGKAAWRTNVIVNEQTCEISGEIFFFDGTTTRQISQNNQVGSAFPRRTAARRSGTR